MIKLIKTIIKILVDEPHTFAIETRQTSKSDVKDIMKAYGVTSWGYRYARGWIWFNVLEEQKKLAQGVINAMLYTSTAVGQVRNPEKVDAQPYFDIWFSGDQ